MFKLSLCPEIKHINVLQFKDFKQNQILGHKAFIVNSKGGDIFWTFKMAEICDSFLIVKKAISASALLTLIVDPSYRYVLPDGFLLLHPLSTNKQSLSSSDYDNFVHNKQRLPTFLNERNPTIPSAIFKTWLKGRCFTASELVSLFDFKLFLGELNF